MSVGNSTLPWGTSKEHQEWTIHSYLRTREQEKGRMIASPLQSKEHYVLAISLFEPVAAVLFKANSTIPPDNIDNRTYKNASAGNRHNHSWKYFDTKLSASEAEYFESIGLTSKRDPCT
jgi:hypothetical protein